jgi:hypothetical protein
MLLISDSILISVISLISLIILLIQKYKTNQTTFDNERSNAHLSTVRRDCIKFILALCQAILFALLTFLRIFYIKDVKESYIFHSGPITICWVRSYEKIKYNINYIYIYYNIFLPFENLIDLLYDVMYVDLFNS